MIKSLIAAALMLGPGTLHAAELETTHLFGFTLGSDVNAVGEKEAETETTGRFAKRDGSYAAVSDSLAVKFIPFDNFSIEPGIAVGDHDIAAVPGLDDRRQFALQSVSLETRYRLLDREHASFGLTLGLDPHWNHVDDVSGEPIDGYGAELLLIADKELVKDRIFGAFNVSYEPDASLPRGTGEWQHQSNFGMSTALSTQIRPGVLVGAEARYLQSYRGLGLDTLAGQALFVGPTFYARFSDTIWMSAAWSIQVAGRNTGETGSLDLTNFERHQAILRFGYNF